MTMTAEEISHALTPAGRQLTASVMSIRWNSEAASSASHYIYASELADAGITGRHDPNTVICAFAGLYSRKSLINNIGIDFGIRDNFALKALADSYEMLRHVGVVCRNMATADHAQALANLGGAIGDTRFSWAGFLKTLMETAQWETVTLPGDSMLLPRQRLIGATGIAGWELLPELFAKIDATMTPDFSIPFADFLRANALTFKGVERNPG